MTDRFAICLPRVLASEGGWSDNPNDPGGATMKGVTLAVFNRFKGRACTKDELRHISDADLAAIYRQGYWDAAHCGQLPAGADYMIFDLAVNSGPGRAVKMLQSVVGVTPDGSVGPATLTAVAAWAPTTLVRDISSHREAYYRSLPTFRNFGRGWLSRLATVTEQALKDAR